MDVYIQESDEGCCLISKGGIIETYLRKVVSVLEEIKAPYSNLIVYSALIDLSKQTVYLIDEFAEVSIIAGSFNYKKLGVM